MSIEVGSGLSDLVAILRAGLSRNVRFPTTVVDWSVVIRLAREHRVLPFVARAVRDRRGGAEGIRPEATAALERSTAEATVGSLAALAALREMRDAFATARIRWIAWKGPALSQRAWDDAAIRQFDDVDVVVHPEDRSAALAALLERGWRSSHRGMSWAQARVVLAGQRAYDLTRTGDGPPVELHWEFGARRYSGYARAADVLARSDALRVGGVDLPVPSPSDELLLHAVHATKHGWSRLEDVLLFARLAVRDDVLREGRAAARRTGATRAMSLGAAVAGRIFPGAVADVDVSSDVDVAPLVDAVVARWQAEDTGWRSTVRWDLAWTDGAARRARLLYHTAFDVTLQEWRFVRLPSPFVDLYRVVRPLRLVARGLGLTRDR